MTGPEVGGWELNSDGPTLKACDHTQHSPLCDLGQDTDLRQQEKRHGQKEKGREEVRGRDILSPNCGGTLRKHFSILGLSFPSEKCGEEGWSGQS